MNQDQPNPNRLIKQVFVNKDFQIWKIQKTKIGYEESTRDLKHRIHRDEHVDTSVNKYDDGDTEVRVCLIKLKITN